MAIEREICFVGSMGVAIDAPLTYVAAVMTELGLAGVASRYITAGLGDQLRETGTVMVKVPMTELAPLLPGTIDAARHRVRLDLMHHVEGPPSSVTSVGSDNIPVIWTGSAEPMRQWDMVVSFEARTGNVDLPANLLDGMIAGPIIAGGLVRQLQTVTRGPIDVFGLPDGLSIVAPLHPTRAYRTPPTETVVGSGAIPPPGGPS
jgi:hypothetical protein